MDYLRVLSLLFFLSFSISIFLGIYILLLDSKSELNRLFFCVCISLGIWAFAFSIVNSTKDYEMVMLWRRISAFGWGTIFSFLLHFLIVLTNHGKILKRKWTYILIYAPSVIFTYVYGTCERTAEIQYDFIYSDVGWVNVSTSNYWDWAFNVYYLLFALTGVVLLFLWLKKIREADKKKPVYMLITSIAITVLFGTVTEMIMNIYTPYKAPQTAPIIGIIPILAIFYAVKRYGLMIPETVPVTEPGRILSKKNRYRLYRAMSKVFFVGGFINFAAQYFFSVNTTATVLLFSFALFVVGTMLHILPDSHFSDDMKDTLFMFLISLSIPVVILSFLKIGGMTVWSLPFLFILMSVVFNKRKMLVGLAVSVLLTQLIVWIQVPKITVQINGADYIVRFTFLTIGIALASFVNKIYISRLEENEIQISFQKMVSTVSAEFISINAQNIEEKINIFLKMTCEHFNADRAYFITMCDSMNSYGWAKDGESPMLDKIPDIVEGGYTWWVRQMERGNIMCYPKVDMMPVESEQEKMILEIHNIKSFMAIPIAQNDKIFGFLFFMAYEEMKTCIENNKALLQIMANLLSEAIIKMESEREINHMAYYDELTGLANRMLFKKLLNEEIKKAKENGTFVAVVFIGLNSFKTVNDTMGHQGGDEMLRKVARRLTECLQKKNLAARFSGDEFLVMITSATNIDEVDRTVEKIRNALKLPLFVKEQEFFVTASAGIAIYPWDGETSDSLIKFADIAKNASRQKGKNNYLVCTQEMKEDVIKKMQLINSLYRAQKREEFVLHYQPQVNLERNEIIGMEALLRWNNPEFGIVSPTVFIPLAEETGLINSIGQWVLETACKQLKKWHDMGLDSLRMSVNLSAEQFMDKKLTTITAKALENSGVDAQYLKLEITESAIAEDEGFVMNTLYELKDLGVSISIDDFGKAYSSLDRLRTMPLDQLKIDMDFVKGLSKGNKDEAIAKTIIQLGRNLDLNVIAEGVETKQQCEFFRQENCDEVQGYYFYKPMPAEELEPLLIKQMKTTRSKM